MDLGWFTGIAHGRMKLGWGRGEAAPVNCTCFCSFYRPPAPACFVVRRLLACRGPELALREFAPSYQRATILQVSLATGGLALGLAAAWQLQDPWVAVGAVLLGASIPFTLIVVFPTNKQLLDPTLDSRSPQATSLLRLWNRLHAIWSLLGATAFGVLLSRAAML